MDTLLFTQHNIFMLLQQMSVFLVIAYLFTKSPVFRTFNIGDLRPKQMIILYVVFSTFSIMGTYFGFPINDAIANTRAIGAVLAGIIGGPALGTAVGLTSGLHRMTLGGFTAVSCGISTTLEGLIGGLFHLYLVRNNQQSKLLSPKIAFIATFIAEVVQMLTILATAKPYTEALALVQVIYLPMIVANSCGSAIFVSIIRDQKSMFDKLGVIFSNKALRIADKTLSILSKGFNEDTADKLAKVIHHETGVGAVAITDREKVLAFQGLGSDHHTVGITLTSPETIRAINEDRIIFVDGVKKQWKCALSDKCPLGSILSVPLRFDNEVIGTINLFEPKDKIFLTMNKTLGEGITNLLSNQLLYARYNKQKSLLVEAELKLIQAQINPHFLFNALNTIIAILRRDSDRARELLLHISNFFRTNLKRKSDLATLEDELDHVNSYLVIEKARFEDRLNIIMDIDSKLLNIKIPVFTLQPLIENSIKHGISDMITPGTVKISAKSIDGMTILAIEDNAGNCGEWDSTGLGMNIVEKCIKSICGDQYGLEVECVPDERTTVTVKLPERGCRSDKSTDH
ncbi:MAG: histidine kinase [Desulfovibrio sp. S3730MH75]|nr:MAG: histidine kinase [Desulfovibrio sp. S3730MH75]